MEPRKWLKWLLKEERNNMSLYEDPDNQDEDSEDPEEAIDIPDIDLDLEEGEVPTLDEDELE